MSFTEGKIVLHYRIVEQIDSGEKGETYLAEDTILKRSVVLKFLPSQSVSEEHTKTQFLQAARGAAAFSHPNLVHIYEMSEYQGRPFLVTESVTDRTLSDLINDGEFSILSVLDTAIQLCEGLIVAHEAGVVHGGLKPASIRIGQNNHVKLGDIGLPQLAGQSESGCTGTESGYLAPEQVRGWEPDQQSDVFSLGTILYEMLTGQQPFHRDSETATFDAILTEAPKPLAHCRVDVPEGLRSIVERMLEKNREIRYQHIGEVLTDLKRERAGLDPDRDFVIALLDTANSLVVCLDKEARITVFNRECERVTGYTREEVIGKSWSEIFLPEDHHHHRLKDFAEWVRQHPYDTYEGPLKTKAGQSKTILWSNSALFSPDSDELTAIAVGQDITERKQAEQVQLVSYRIANAANISKDLDELFGSIRKELGTILDTTNFFIALYNEQSNTITLPYHVDERDSFDSLPAGKTLTAYVIRNDKSLLATEDVKKQLVEDGEVETIGAPSKVWLGVPLKIKDKVVGALVVQHYTDASAYSEKDLEILRFTSGQIAVAIERRRSEEALRKSERWSRTVIAASKDAMVAINQEGLITIFNPSAERMFGLKAEEMIGHPLDRLMPEEHRGPHRRYVKSFFATGEPHRTVGQTLELLALRSDGSMFPIELSLSAGRSGDQQFVLAVIRDITERKRAETLTETRLQLLNNLRACENIDACLEAGCKAIYEAGFFKRAVLTLHNDKREIINLGQVGLDENVIKAARNAPAPNEEVSRKMTQEKFRISHSYFIPEEAGLSLDETARYVAQTDQAEERDLSWKAGDELFIPIIGDDNRHEGWLSVDTPFNGQRPTVEVVKFLEVTVDIVTQKMREIRMLDELRQGYRALQESEERYRTLAENLPQRIFYKDRNSVYVTCNDNYAKDLKTAPHEIAGKTDYDFYTPELAEKYRTDDARIMESGRSEEIEEQYIQDGHEIIVQTVKTPVRDKIGNITGVLGIFWDITDRKKMEEALQKAHDELEQRVEERTAELADINRKLREEIENRTRAQEALRESEERFRSIFEHTTIGMYRTTPDGRILMANPTLLRMMGYSSLEELAQRNLDETGYEPQYTRADFKQRIESEEQVIGLESAWIRQDHSTLYVRESATAIRDEAGKILYYEGTVEDITDIKQAEEALRQSEAKFRGLFENVLEGVYQTRPDGKILSANPALVQMLGYDSEEELCTVALAQNLYVNPEDRKILTRKLDTEGELRNVEFRLKRRDGREIMVLENARAILNEQGEVSHYEGVLTDITERKEAEKTLQKSEAHYRAVVEDQTELICRFLPDTTLTFVNEAYCRYFGKKREELVGRSFMALIPLEDHEKVRRHFTSLGADNPVSTHEHPAVIQGGETRWQQWTNRAILDKEGNIVELQAVGRDITELKKTEERLQRTTDKLKAEHEALTEKNIALKQILEHIEKERQNYKQRICQDIEQAISPILKRLKKKARPTDANAFEILENDLKSILAKDIDVFRDRYSRLTPREVEICELIRNTMSSKQISNCLNLSLYTVHKHREQIRKKLGIANKKINLSTYLQSR